MRQFFSTYYHPGNASIALAGDINLDEALARVEAYFGELPAGPIVDRVALPDAELDGERRLVLEDRVELPRLYLAWLSPAMFAPDDAELDIAADILANGKTSRLYRRLIFEERLATDVMATQNSRESAGFLQIGATATPGRSLGALEQVINEEITRLADEGPTADEMERERVQAEAQFIFRLRYVGGFGGKSDQLNAYNTFLGDPDFFPRDLQRYQLATAASVQAAVRRYLDHRRRIALSVVPRQRRALALADAVAAVVS